MIDLDAIDLFLRDYWLTASDRHEVALSDIAQSLVTEVRRLRADAFDCDICAGTGTPLSGGPCTCGGTGRARDVLVCVREQLAALRERLAAERAEMQDRARRLK